MRACVPPRPLGLSAPLRVAPPHPCCFGFLFYGRAHRADYGTFQLYSGEGATAGLGARLLAYSSDLVTVEVCPPPPPPPPALRTLTEGSPTSRRVSQLPLGAIALVAVGLLVMCRRALPRESKASRASDVDTARASGALVLAYAFYMVGARRAVLCELMWPSQRVLAPRVAMDVRRWSLCRFVVF